MRACSGRLSARRIRNKPLTTEDTESTENEDQDCKPRRFFFRVFRVFRGSRFFLLAAVVVNGSCEKLTGLVLAGGKSSRMGRDKAGLIWADGRSFLDRAIDLLEQAGCARVIVSGERPGYDCVPDRWPGQGPLGGIASVLSACPELTGPWLIVPVDMPQLEVDDLAPLQSAGQGRDGAVFSGLPLPMVLGNGERIRETILAQLRAGRRALKALGDTLDLAAIDPPTSRLRDNINTPEDYRRGSEDAEPERS